MSKIYRIDEKPRLPFIGQAYSLEHIIECQWGHSTGEDGEYQLVRGSVSLGEKFTQDLAISPIQTAPGHLFVAQADSGLYECLLSCLPYRARDPVATPAERRRLRLYPLVYDLPATDANELNYVYQMASTIWGPGLGPCPLTQVMDAEVGQFVLMLAVFGGASQPQADDRAFFQHIRDRLGDDVEMLRYAAAVAKHNQGVLRELAAQFN